MISVAPASNEFSTSSLIALHGLASTSPAAIRFTTSCGRRWINPMPGKSLQSPPTPPPLQSTTHRGDFSLSPVDDPECEHSPLHSSACFWRLVSGGTMMMMRWMLGGGDGGENDDDAVLQMKKKPLV
ncbi:hypothetical protein GCK72_008752 [Caenorhabditis remanei]|uniref:Uncharacterized protein n=1 Tax=Caenorhabditis remanei TaxID=31234 RepID=A0A6A5H1Q4_CAERE|nr:hypothetical protein GCK72_008752 [Caenorhabditis remanei]KAF1760503.1 hypothetical protein GCK72_008752 [Caenorhabditis remanei]